jgi:hypothetical protein
MKPFLLLASALFLFAAPTRADMLPPECLPKPWTCGMSKKHVRQFCEYLWREGWTCGGTTRHRF